MKLQHFSTEKGVKQSTRIRTFEVYDAKAEQGIYTCIYIYKCIHIYIYISIRRCKHVCECLQTSLLAWPRKARPWKRMLDWRQCPDPVKINLLAG